MNLKEINVENFSDMYFSMSYDDENHNDIWISTLNCNKNYNYVMNNTPKDNMLTYYQTNLNLLVPDIKRILHVSKNKYV